MGVQGKYVDTSEVLLGLSTRETKGSNTEKIPDGGNISDGGNNCSDYGYDPPPLPVSIVPVSLRGSREPLSSSVESLPPSTIVFVPEHFRDPTNGLPSTLQVFPKVGIRFSQIVGRLTSKPPPPL